jgi:hypothetical protein
MTASDKRNLTLYGISTQLMELLILRDEITSDPDMTPAEQKDSLAALDDQIRDVYARLGHAARLCRPALLLQPVRQVHEPGPV